MSKLSLLCTLAVVGLLSFSCQKKDEVKPDNEANWVAPFVLQRTSAGQPVPTSLLLDCRTKDSTGVYYYFQVIGDLVNQTTPVSDGNLVRTRILNAELIVAMVSSTDDKNEVINYLQLPVDLFSSQKGNSIKKYVLNANAETIARIVENYSDNESLMSLKLPSAENPKDESNSRILTISSQGSIRIHEGGITLPGLTVNSALICKSNLKK